MRALDTNVLARFFVDDADDAQAAKQQADLVHVECPAAGARGAAMRSSADYSRSQSDSCCA
jgi:hypothetical protein